MITHYKKKLFLIAEKPFYTYKELVALFPGKTIYACDFAVAEINLAAQKQRNLVKAPGGYKYRKLVSIDHHAPNKEMASRVTSTELATRQVKSAGLPDFRNSVVVISHVDTDSVLSGLLMAGLLKPSQKLVAAALSSDHLGKENQIADLLDALKNLRSLRTSIINLEKLLAGVDLPALEKKAVKIKKQRALASKLVQASRFKKIGLIDLCINQKALPLDLFLPFLPQAKIIMLAAPYKKHKDLWEVKIRLGARAPKELRLNEIVFSKKDDFGWRGRWNAGSNSRSGGTSKTPAECAEILNKYLQNFFIS